MFKLGDVVVYGTQGVCKIERTETKQIGKNSAEYYVLKPVFNEGTSLFVPVDNQVLISRMHPVLTKTEVEELVKFAENADVTKCNDEISQKEEYQTVLVSNDRKKLVLLIKTIRAEKELRHKSARKLTVNDERVLHKAEQLLYNELGYVLGIEPQEAEKVIKF